jgi:ABC-type dipeptide/oligopeptide/nickel transport system permease component
MARYVAGRIFQAVLGLVFIATLVFFVVRLTGDPGRILTSEFAPVEVQQEIRERLGLDEPLIVQYASYMSGLATGDLGRSFNGEPVIEILMDRLPATASLAFAALIVAVLLAIPLGVLSAVYQGSPVDIFSRTVALFGQSVPAFWLAIMLVLIFAVILRILPVAYSQGPESYVLPSIAVGWAAVAGIARLVRSSMLDVLGSDYVRMARAKGLPSRVVVLKHGLRSAMVPVLTFSGLVLGSFLNGSVVVETVFAWPGIGQLTLDAVNGRDFPVVQGAVLLIALFFITINLAVDLLYAALDPRIRYR